MGRYLVTGGAGFIGSHLVDALLARGDEAVVLDDLSTGHLSNLPPGVRVIQGDVADVNAVSSAVTGVDGCFHLAAVASVQRSNEDWLGTHRTNLTGTITVLDAARTAGSNGSQIPVVYASSAAVYGDAKDLPISETTPTRPLTAYGADKLGSELHARVASHVHGVPTTGMRFFNVYGPRQDPKSPYSGVISVFAESVMTGRRIGIHGDGGQTRDFIFVGDVVDHLMAAMATSTTTSRVFNVCTGNATSILYLARTLMKAAGRSFEIKHGPARAGDIRESVGDPSRAIAGLGLRAVTPLADGLCTLLA
ncbi:MAG: NAD-dependent epimerase/dehydratase family protein [Alphaproteobacteria bacterium]|nr:NAD-dependent epimerase/dehydratase family protein [Alphaproteobacteria bacterium]